MTLIEPEQLGAMRDPRARRDFEPDQNLFLRDEGFSFPPDEDPAMKMFTNFAPEEPVDDFGPAATLDLEGLLYTGYLTDSFDRFGHSFMIRTLRRGEKLAVGSLVAQYDGTIGMADAFQTAYVSAALMTVDGRSLSQPLGPEDTKNPITWISRNWNVVSQWFDPVLEVIYERYSDLVVRQTQAFLALQGKS